MKQKIIKFVSTQMPWSFMNKKLAHKIYKKLNRRLSLYLVCSGKNLFFITNGLNMKKISSLVLSFVVAALALASTGIAAAIDGAISVVSSDPSVLLVTPTGDGKFHVQVIGIGLATLTVSGDVDLGEGVRQISKTFDFEVYDGSIEADHFDLVLSEITLRPIDTGVSETTEDTGSSAEKKESEA